MSKQTQLPINIFWIIFALLFITSQGSSQTKSDDYRIEGFHPSYIDRSSPVSENIVFYLRHGSIIIEELDIRIELGSLELNEPDDFISQSVKERIYFVIPDIKGLLDKLYVDELKEMYDEGQLNLNIFINDSLVMLNDIALVKSDSHKRSYLIIMPDGGGIGDGQLDYFLDEVSEWLKKIINAEMADIQIAKTEDLTEKGFQRMKVSSIREYLKEGIISGRVLNLFKLLDSAANNIHKSLTIVIIGDGRHHPLGMYQSYEDEEYQEVQALESFMIPKVKEIFTGKFVEENFIVYLLNDGAQYFDEMTPNVLISNFFRGSVFKLSEIPIVPTFPTLVSLLSKKYTLQPGIEALYISAFISDGMEMGNKTIVAKVNDQYLLLYNDGEHFDIDEGDRIFSNFTFDFHKGTGPTNVTIYHGGKQYYEQIVVKTGNQNVPSKVKDNSLRKTGVMRFINGELIDNNKGYRIPFHPNENDLWALDHKYNNYRINQIDVLPKAMIEIVGKKILYDHTNGMLEVKNKLTRVPSSSEVQFSALFEITTEDEGGLFYVPVKFNTKFNYWLIHEESIQINIQSEDLTELEFQFNTNFRRNRLEAKIESKNDSRRLSIKRINNDLYKATLKHPFSVSEGTAILTVSTKTGQLLYKKNINEANYLLYFLLFTGAILLSGKLFLILRRKKNITEEVI